MGKRSAKVQRAKEWERGRVIRKQGGFFAVVSESQGDEVLCRLRGRLKQRPRTGDLIAVGDWVWFRRLPDGTGVIEEIESRERALVRKAPTARGEYEQVILANPDQVVLVFACAQPEPKLGMLDRFLVITEQQEIPAVVVANKVDLVGKKAAREIFGLYEDIGYPVIYTSAVTGYGLKTFKRMLTGKVSVLAGPSGTGKSSLLNAIQPGLGLAVREVSRSGEGRHTTTVRQMFPLEGGGYVADTPGLKALALWDIEPEELDGYFPELRELVPHCQFHNCTHLNEPGCAVLQALEEGRIHPSRYASYVRLRLELEHGLERSDLA